MLTAHSLIPLVGLGTWKADKGVVGAAVKTALDAGYRHLDCAFAYLNEAEIGEALQEYIQRTNLSREHIWLTSKLWNTFHKPQDVETNVKMTLRDLKVDYLDLYLIHWPHAFQSGGDYFPKDADGNMVYDFDTHFLDTWTAMEELVRKGLVKNIGVSNFNQKQLQQILDKATIPPSMLQIECHPYLCQRELVDFATKHNIAVTAYSPLGSGDAPAGKPRIIENETVVDIARKHNKTPAQVLIRFQIDRNICVIPKSSTPERIRSNFEVFDFHLDEDDMQRLLALDCGWRACALTRDKHHPLYPFEDQK